MKLAYFYLFLALSLSTHAHWRPKPTKRVLDNYVKQCRAVYQNLIYPQPVALVANLSNPVPNVTFAENVKGIISRISMFKKHTR